MAFIDFVDWQPKSNDIFAWRYPADNLSTATQLVVRESQEALLFSKGKIIAKFGPGKHTLTSENIPLLRNLFGIPFGGRNPFTAEVWFTNKAAPLTIDWRTTSARIMDADYGVMVPIVAVGRYGLKVEDSERFLIKLVGTLNEFNSAQLTDHFMGPLITKTNSTIVSYMTANKIGIMQIAAYLEQLSRFMEAPLKEFWEDYGMALTGFYVTSIDLDTATADGKKIADAMSDRSAQSIAGYTWQQKEAFNVANKGISSNSQLGVLGAAVMTGVVGNAGFGGAMMTPFNAMAGGALTGGLGAAVTNGGGGSSPLNAKKEVFCSNCGKKFSTNSKFCPYCGDVYNPCPYCGSDNMTGAARCVTCGASLTAGSVAGKGGNVCNRCGVPLQAGVKFCPNCGAKL